MLYILEAIRGSDEKGQREGGLELFRVRTRRRHRITIIDIEDVGPKLKELLAGVGPGGEVVISAAGKHVARITATTVPPAPEFGYFKGEVRMAEDFDVLPPEELAEWEK